MSAPLWYSQVLLFLPENIPLGKGKSTGAAWRVSHEQK